MQQRLKDRPLCITYICGVSSPCITHSPTEPSGRAFFKQPLPLPDCIIEHSESKHQTRIIKARGSATSASCPSCRQPSQRVHSFTTRAPADLPLGGQPVQLQLSVRRFYCPNSTCERRTFTEQLPDLLAFRARSTQRLLEAQRSVGVALGGEAGARLLARLAMPTDPDTLLRLVRKAHVATAATPRVLGVDDWAMRKERTYGTILVDLEEHRVVDLLPDRTSETLSAWLREHPGVEILSRDRSTEYAKAAREGAPQAEQVADRWHLLLNLRQMLERYLPGVYERLKHLPDAATADSSVTPKRTRAYRRTGAEVVASRESRKRRLARFEEVKQLYTEGKNLSVISRELALDIKTVRTYAYADAFPERTRQPGPSILDPYLSYLNRRHQAGCENASQLWREIVQQGFPGSKRQVLRWMRETRQTPAPTTPGRYLEGVRTEKRTAVEEHTGAIPRLPSAKQLAWLFIQEPAKAPGKNAPILARVLQDAEVAQVYALARTFADFVRHKRPEALDTWLEGCAASSVNALSTFAAGIQQDYKAVRSALELPWSNAQTEGQITRLKFIKRMMYGRANFDLLRQRVLLAA